MKVTSRSVSPSLICLVRVKAAAGTEAVMAPFSRLVVEYPAQIGQQGLGIEFAPAGGGSLSVNIEISMFVNRPAAGHPAAKIEIFIQIDKAFENQPFDLTAGAVI